MKLTLQSPIPCLAESAYSDSFKFKLRKKDVHFAGMGVDKHADGISKSRKGNDRHEFNSFHQLLC